MKNLLVLIAFVSSCGPLKIDSANASESNDAFQIVVEMMNNNESCESIQDFLLDTSLDHDLEYECDVE